MEPTLKTRLGRRETWLEVAGAVGYFIALGLHAGGLLSELSDAQVATMYFSAISLFGSGTVAHVKRGAQRAEEAYYAATSTSDPPEAAEAPQAAPERPERTVQPIPSAVSQANLLGSPHDDDDGAQK